MNIKTIACLSLGCWAAGAFAAEVEIKTPADKVGYAIGLNLGANWKRQGLGLDNINCDTFLQGIKDSLNGATPRLTENEIREVMMAFQQEMKVKQEERNKVLATKNQQEGAAFLAANKTKEGVKVTPSGLQYKVITEGTGDIPKATDTVVTHYRGTLLDGTEFDSSHRRGEPATFPVNGVIKGWTEALQMMKVGSKWQLFIPAELAYGERGAGRDIGPNATLVFEIELLSIKAGS